MPVKDQVRKVLPDSLWRSLTWTASHARWARDRVRGEAWAPPRGLVRFGSFRRLRPFNRFSGGGRGLPVDRYYIERFLEANAGDIRGHALEIAEPTYLHRFGGERVERIDVLHVTGESPHTTIVGDLTSADHIPSDRFDCVVLTQTLHCIYDFRSAISTLHRILKPGGVLLATFPGIANVSRPDMDRWGQYWSFTSLASQRAFGEAFVGGEVEVESHGNVLAATAFLWGLAAQELTERELSFRDPDYQVLLTVRAVKGRAAGDAASASLASEG
jgi:SAM-dependent methyltransferase